jgi:superfamily II DNA/RNA helicase
MFLYTFILKEIKLIKKAYNLIKNMLFNGDKKCICYLTTIEKANIFNKILSLISTTFNIEIEREQIDCNTKRMKRNEIIDKFKNSDKMYILLNVHVLDEGIDIPECDSVYITQPNNNIINIVQRMCRANRIYKNKTECDIYLWCSKNKTNKILTYLFEKIEENIKNKIFIQNGKKFIFEPSKNKTLDICNFETFIFEPSKNKTLDICNFETFINNYNFTNNDFSKNFFNIIKENYKDFYNIIKEDYIERYNEFLIDSEILRNLLKIKIKRSFNDTIKRSYKKNIDYKIEKIKKTVGRGGHNLEVITLTPEAVKKICLSTKSIMGVQVQQYFLDLEVALYKYKNYIIEDLNTKIY